MCLDHVSWKTKKVFSQLAKNKKDIVRITKKFLNFSSISPFFCDTSLRIQPPIIFAPTTLLRAKQMSCTRHTCSQMNDIINVKKNSIRRQVTLKLSRHLFALMPMYSKTYFVVETHFVEGGVDDNRSNLDVPRNVLRVAIFSADLREISSVRCSCDLVKYDHPLPLLNE